MTPRESLDAVAHHDLCFGCGIANLFGLQMEVERDGDHVAGRFFVKQDHGGRSAVAHPGVLAAALEEAISLVAAPPGDRAYTRRLELDFDAGAALGTYVQVEASVERREGDDVWVTAVARAVDGTALARARGLIASAAADA